MDLTGHWFPGKNFCLAQIGQLFTSHSRVDSIEQIQNIFMFLRQSEDLSKHADSFMETSLFEMNHDPFILAPLLSDKLHEAICSR